MAAIAEQPTHFEFLHISYRNHVTTKARGSTLGLSDIMTADRSVGIANLPNILSYGNENENGCGDHVHAGSCMMGRSLPTLHNTTTHLDCTATLVD